MATEGGRLGVLVGGGPAPGIKGTITAAVIEAVNSSLDVIGIYDGFEHLMKGREDVIRPLAISDVSRIHSQGGSVLRTSRANPTRDGLPILPPKPAAWCRPPSCPRGDRS